MLRLLHSFQACDCHANGLNSTLHMMFAGMNIKMLQPKTEESQRLVDWVEKGTASCTAKLH